MPNGEDISRIQEHGEQLEGRVSGLERDVQHALRAITQTNENMGDGFAETRRMFEETERRSDQRAETLQGMIGEVNDRFIQRNQWSTPVLFGAATLFLMLGGVIVTFVNMTTAPMNNNTLETRDELHGHMDLDGHHEAMQAHAKTQIQVTDAHYEIEKLHSLTLANTANHMELVQRLTAAEAGLEQAHKELDRRWAEILSGAENRGRLNAMIENLRLSYESVINKIESSSADRFFGREGAAMGDRLDDIEKFLRENPPPKTE